MDQLKHLLLKLVLIRIQESSMDQLQHLLLKLLLIRIQILKVLKNQGKSILPKIVPDAEEEDENQEDRDADHASRPGKINCYNTSRRSHENTPD